MSSVSGSRRYITALPMFALMAIIGIGAWSGAFVMHLFAQGSERAVQSVSGLIARMQKPFLTTMLWLPISTTMSP